ncbi:helix-turn-helix domain-containing protein [Paenibacillus sp. CAU 1782]
MYEINRFLRELRNTRKLTLREASEKSGLSHSYISSLENGKHPKTKAPIMPSPDSLKRLAEAYNYEYEELMKTAGHIERGEESNEDILPKRNQEFVIKEIVEKYNVDLDEPGAKEKLEQIIQIVFGDMKKK